MSRVTVRKLSETSYLITQAEEFSMYDAVVLSMLHLQEFLSGAMRREAKRMAKFVSMRSVLKTKALLYAEKPDEALAAVDAASPL